MNFCDGRYIVIANSADLAHSNDLPIYNPIEEEGNYWFQKGQERLSEHLKQKLNTNIAKNVIFFLGDGMSLATQAATRVYLGNENIELEFEKFPYTALSKTYCVDAQVAESACAATAYLTGVKGNQDTIGVTAKVKVNDCKAMQNKDNHVSSILAWAQQAGKATGFVTTTRVTHATPGGTYVHTAQRKWESDEMVRMYGEDPNKCMDNAKQLVLNEPGKNFKVILGGGRKNFLPKTFRDQEGSLGNRSDNINLIETWISERSKHGNASYVWNNDELKRINPAKTDYLLGLFEPEHCQYHLDIVAHKTENMEPSLPEMVEKAIQILSKEKNGYFLFVEGGMIDNAHHDVHAKRALEETAEFSRAVGKAVKMTDQDNTLIVATADHSHMMTVGGKAKRGNSIFGVGFSPKLNEWSDLPVSSIVYGSGPGFYKHINHHGVLQNFSTMNSDAIDFQFPSAMPSHQDNHGIDDVGVYSVGPWAHLFVGNIEQNVIPHIIAYASCLGSGKVVCKSSTSAASGSSLSFITVFVLICSNYLI